MALAVIGAGFGRTGTDSMKRALEELGFGPTHHMREVLADPAAIARWRAIAAGARPDWDEVFTGWRSTVDWPSALFWRELAGYYPEAKVILTVRDPASWYTSFSATIQPHVVTGDPESIGCRLIGERVFGGRADDRAHAIAVYERNNAEVQAAIPAERLLVFRLGEGWEKLCPFLGVPVPDTPFPHVNTAAEFRAAFAEKDHSSSE